MSWPLVVFISIFFVELPDKTSLVCLTLVSRYRPLIVWVGASLALGAQTLVALAAGRLLALMPHRIFAVVEAGLFLALAIWLFKESREPPESEKGAMANPTGPLTKNHEMKALIQVFGIVFLAEFFDLTQMETVAFAVAHPGALWLVGAAAALGLIMANAIVVGIGRAVVHRVPRGLVQRIAALMFFIIGLGILVSWAHRAIL